MSASRHTSPRQNKDAERSFFDGLAATGERFAPKPAGEYGAVLAALDIDHDLSGMRVLEAGCATGDFGVMLAERGAVVTGVDLSGGMIELNRTLNAGVPNYSAMTGDLEDPDLFDAGSFDAVACFNVLHHFPDIGTITANFARWLVPGGVVWAEEPNGGNPVNRMSKIVRGAVKFISPATLHRKYLSTLNEERDYTMEEYRAVFTGRGFTCDHAVPLSVTGGKAVEKHGLDAVISTVKHGLYAVTARLARDPMSRGQYLVFVMRRY